MLQEQKLYVLGHPVEHSKSPVMHNAAYAALGLNWHYDFMDCESPEEAQAFLCSDLWLACNITMPYKPQAFSMAKTCSKEALLAEGANVLIRTREGVYADNTDGKGCISYLKRCGVHFEGASVIVCGTGPTSQAIMHAACEAGARELYLLGRDKLKAQKIVRAYGEKLQTAHEPQAIKVPQVQLGCSANSNRSSDLRLMGSNYDEAKDAIARADIIIDATPLGMNPGDPAPFDTELLQPNQAVFDVVYGHGLTALLGAAQRQGCLTFDGAGMLVAQAVETVYDLNAQLDLSLDLKRVDLFQIMAQAAQFQLR